MTAMETAASADLTGRQVAPVLFAEEAGRAEPPGVRAMLSHGGSTNVASWTQDTATKAAGQTMPAYDDIQFASIDIVGQPAIDWQNRPTFQQVAQFRPHR